MSANTSRNAPRVKGNSSLMYDFSNCECPCKEICIRITITAISMIIGIGLVILAAASKMTVEAKAISITTFILSSLSISALILTKCCFASKFCCKGSKETEILKED